MIPQADTLHTIAEVGIAITGFAGIVAAVDRRSGGAKSTVHDPLSNLLGTSLGVVFFAFVPEWVAAAGAASDAVWQISNGLHGVFRICYVAVIFHSARRASPGERSGLMLSIGAGLGGLQLIAAMGALPAYHYFLYLTALLWGLSVALRNFSRLLLRPPVDPRPDEDPRRADVPHPKATSQSTT